MSKRLKMWLYAAALFGGTMLGSGCWDGNARWVWAVLREDLFS